MGYCETTSTTDNAQQQQKQLQTEQHSVNGNEGQLVGRAVPQYTLYVIANSEKERSEWIRAIRQGKRTAKALALAARHDPMMTPKKQKSVRTDRQ